MSFLIIYQNELALRKAQTPDGNVFFILWGSPSTPFCLCLSHLLFSPPFLSPLEIKFIREILMFLTILGIYELSIILSLYFKFSN